MTQVTPTIMRNRNITFNSLGSKTCKTLVHGKKYYILSFIVLSYLPRRSIVSILITEWKDHGLTMQLPMLKQ